ncbi:MAG TPA: hypothetical protein VIH58_09215, partial [Chthoniobacterales bacterium]
IDNAQLELSIQPRFYSITNEFAWLERICKNSTIRWLKTVGTIEVDRDETPKTEALFARNGAENSPEALSQLESKIGKAKAAVHRDA